MSNNPKIKLLGVQPQSGGIKINSPDFPIDPNKQNDFMSLLDANQQEINLNECQYNLSPQRLNNTYNFQYWQFEFVGQGNFQGRKISGVLKFPPDFPKNAPKFFFDPLPNGDVIQHVNIYGDNLLCIPLLSHWNPQTSTMEILQAIEHIFANPNWGEGDAPANPPFSSKSEAERNSIQQAQAQLLPWFVKE